MFRPIVPCTSCVTFEDKHTAETERPVERSSLEYGFLTVGLYGRLFLGEIAKLSADVGLRNLSVRCASLEEFMLSG